MRLLGKKVGRKIMMVAAIAVSTALLLAGCGSTPKEPVTGAAFAQAAEALDFVYQDITDQYEADAPYIEQCIVSLKDDTRVEYYLVSDADTAKQMFASNQEQIEAAAGNSSSKSSVSKNGYSKFTMKSDGTVYIVIRVENTMIYSRADSSQSKDLDQFLKQIGY